MLASSLAFLALVYAAGVSAVWRSAGTGCGVRRIQALAFAGSSTAIALALSPWVDEMSERSLAAHMVQHELLMVVAAPLMAASAPMIALVWAFPTRARTTAIAWVRRQPIGRLWTALTAPASVFVLHLAALWTWHLPALYGYALAHEGVHVLQHFSFFGTAALFWWGIAHGRFGRAGYGAAVVYVFATALHGGLLGALLAFSPRVWYTPYLTTTAWFTPLEDQQLAGLLMWVPAGLITAAGGLIFFTAWLRESDRHTRFKAATSAKATS